MSPEGRLTRAAARIVVTNDDGIFGPGLLPLARALAGLGEVCIIAPERERSAVSHSLSLFAPVRVRTVRLDGVVAHAVDGTPADCARLGILEFQHRRTDIVVSGINRGANMGQDVVYSGTVAAAREAVFLGRAGIAVSMVDDGDFTVAARIAFELTRAVLRVRYRGLLNVNLPAGPLRGVRVTSLGDRRYEDVVHRRTDPFGTPYYWLKSDPVSTCRSSSRSDVEAVRRGYVSVTPLTHDMTDRRVLGRVTRIARAATGAARFR